MSDPTIQAPTAPGAQATGSWQVSLAEIDAMGRKAAQGAGFTWGMAEEAGRAARWLAAYGLAGPETLLRLLQQVDGRVRDFAPEVQERPWRSAAGPLCPLAAGAALSDRADRIAGGARFELGPVLAPLLTVPFLCRAARDLDCVIVLTGPGVRLAATPAGPACAAWDVFAAARDLSFGVAREPDAAGPGLTAGASARSLPVGIWRALDLFAQRTYVPASEDSRRRGAGAGLRDLD